MRMEIVKYHSYLAIAVYNDSGFMNGFKSQKLLASTTVTFSKFWKYSNKLRFLP